jgi:hypothetical protein
METSFYKFRKYKVYDRDDDRFGPHLYLQPYSQVVHIGVLPLMCCAALFIDPENSSLQRPIVSLSGRLSLGAQPSRSRPPWVELIRFSSAPPQTWVLAIVRSTDAGDGNKKAAKTSPGGSTPVTKGCPAKGPGLDLTALMSPSTATMGTLSKSRGLCQVPNTTRATTKPAPKATASMTQ